VLTLIGLFFTIPIIFIGVLIGDVLNVIYQGINLVITLIVFLYLKINRNVRKAFLLRP